MPSREQKLLFFEVTLYVSPKPPINERLFLQMLGELLGDGLQLSSPSVTVSSAGRQVWEDRSDSSLCHFSVRPALFSNTEMYFLSVMALGREWLPGPTV